MANPFDVFIKLGAQLQSGFQKTFKTARQQIQGAEEDATSLRDNLSKNADKRAGLYGELMKVGGVAVTLGLPIKQAIDFQEAFADVRKVVDGSAKELMGVRSEILNMAPELGMVPRQIAAIQEAAGQSGIAREELADFTRVASMMATAFDMTAKTSGESMSNWRASMGLTGKEVMTLADSINHLSNKMNASAGSVTQITTRYGAVGKAAGLSVTEIAALAAAMKSSGAGAEIAGTGMKNFLGALTDGEAATGRQLQALEALGFQSEELAEAMQNDAQGAIMSVLEALEKQPRARQGSLVGMLFGEESKAAIQPLLTNMDTLRNAFELVADEAAFAGSMQREFNERSNTVAFSLRRLWAQVQVLAINLGDTLLPAVNRVTEILTGISGVVADMAKRFPGLTRLVFGSAVAFTALAAATIAAKIAGTLYGDMSMMLGAALTRIRKLTWATVASFLKLKLIMVKELIMGAIPALIGILKVLFAFVVANPFAAAIAAAALLVTAWKPARDFFVAFLEAAGATIKGIIRVVSNFLLDNALVRGIMKNFQPMFDWLRELEQWLGGILGGGTEWLREWRDTADTWGRNPEVTNALTAAAAAPVGTPGSVTTNVGGIVINPPPGTDEQAIARGVADELSRRERQQGRNQRTRLYD